MKTDLVVTGYLIHGGRILLIKHRKSGLWLPPGGHIDRNEAPDDSLRREFMEEMNLRIEVLNRNDVPKAGNIRRQLAVPFYVNVHSVGDHEHCCFHYLCRTKDPGKLRMNRSEVDDYGWFSPKELGQKKIPPDVRNIARKAFRRFKAL
jgi:8-oxo-dGTP pyrophosphatase MutT (NUDIX family)